MKEIQELIHSKLKENQTCSAFLPYVGIFLFVYAAYLVIGSFNLPNFLQIIFNFTGRIFYFAYFAALIGCFAKKEYLPMAVVFASKVLCILIDLVVVVFFNEWLTFTQYFSFSLLVNIAVYGVLACLLLLAFLNSASDVSAAGSVNPSAATKFCHQCGQKVPFNAPFCDRCGNKL